MVPFCGELFGFCQLDLPALESWRMWAGHKDEVESLEGGSSLNLERTLTLVSCRIQEIHRDVFSQLNMCERALWHR